MDQKLIALCHHAYRDFTMQSPQDSFIRRLEDDEVLASMVNHKGRITRNTGFLHMPCLRMMINGCSKLRIPQVRLHRRGEPVKNDPYLVMRTVSDLVLFGGRLFPVYKRILFPNHKAFLDALRKALEKPSDIVEFAEQVLRYPNQEHANSCGSKCVSERYICSITLSADIQKVYLSQEREKRTVMKCLRV